MSTRTVPPARRRTLAAICAGAFLTMALPALAVDVKSAGKFELDSNATEQNTAGDDWQTLVSGNGNADVTTHIMADINSPDFNFIGGGSKDPLPISSWQFNAQKMTPDKDNITNAYAAAYTSGGHLLFYFGADRLAVNGDAQLGFWFFKNAVGIDPGTGKFSGEHHNDDTLVQVNFLNGGKTAQIGVFKWAGGALTKIVERSITSNGGVTEVCTPGNLACARTNVSGTTPAYWPYAPKSGTAGVFPAQAFFEGGIDVTELVGGDLCFSTFMAETRSSQPFDATLKDFVLGPLETCSIGVSKSCNATRATTDAEYAAVGTASYHKLWASSYTVTVTNTGAGGLPSNTVISYLDDAGSPGDTSDDQTGSHTGALAAGASYTFDERTFFTNSNGVVNSVTAMAEFAETLVAGPATSQCPTGNITGSISVVKDCSVPGVELVPVNGKLAAKVNVQGAVCNNGQDGLTMTVNSLVDLIGTDPLNPVSSHDVTPASALPYDLAPGACLDYTDSYFPSQGDGDTSPAGLSSFSDTVSASATNAHLSAPVTALSDAATCPICVPAD
jgi:hypothetical protein